MGITSVRSQPTPNWINNINPQNKTDEKINNNQNETKQSTNPDSKSINEKIEERVEPDREKKQKIQKLRQRDREVRQHESAHKSAGGPYVGSISYTYKEGPDGRQYAVGGSAQIDTSPIYGEPEKTVEKAKVVKRAALAPPEPSSQDLQIASQADQMKQEAKTEVKNSKQPKSSQKIVDKYKRMTSFKLDSYGQHFDLIA